MKITMTQFLISLYLCSHAFSQKIIFTPIKVFDNSTINVERINDLKRQDSSEENRMLEDRKPPFRWVNKQDILKNFLSPKKGKNTVYILSSAEKWDNNKPPFLGEILHILLTVEIDENKNFVSGYSYPLEYAQHFLSSEIRKISIKGNKFENLAIIEITEIEAKERQQKSLGIIDLTWIDAIND
jgi:hypothetical protein